MALLWTEPEDVKGRWIGDELPATDAQLETFLEDAEDIILSEFPDLPDRIDAEKITPERVARVASRMVIRFLRNPEGIASALSVTGPYTENVTRNKAYNGEIYLTDEDRADLSGAAGRRAFTVDTMPSSARLPGHWVSPTDWEPLP